MKPLPQEKAAGQIVKNENKFLFTFLIKQGKLELSGRKYLNNVLNFIIFIV